MSAVSPLSPPKLPIASATATATNAEWLEADGIGGFASGPVSGGRIRRYHALLMTATAPPTGRVVQVNGVEVWVEGDGWRLPLTTNHYLPDVIYPDGWQHLAAFEREPWPAWTSGVPGNATLRQEIFVARDSCETVLLWRVSDGV